MRFAVDTGGTFTDLVVETENGAMRMYKALTVASDPVKGVIETLQMAADDAAESLDTFLARGEMLIYGTTHALNAIITGKIAKTAFLTSEGHADTLVLRQGGRREPFNHTIPYPPPYVPRRLTFQIPERINSGGQVFKPLDEAAVIETIKNLQDLQVEAVGVCFLWSILNPLHEERVGQLLNEYLPEAKVTLSHKLNPCVGEYARAVSTCIDASLKPMMTRYMTSLEERLRDSGFNGRVLVLTSQAGMVDAQQIAEAPIYSINSGPSTAPVAGRHYAGLESELNDVIVADTGGTTYDISLARDGFIPFTKESWLGQPHRSDITGFPSVDVRSVGAGGGSIAWLDNGGVLHVGPQSAGAEPGPVCYGKGGKLPTFTDACLVLGYIDPDYFLGGSMKLNRDSAVKVMADIAGSLAMSVEQAASAIVGVATENMVQAIADITINRGVDPANACLIGGGGAAGLNSVLIARRLGCPQLLIPSTGAGLSAAGALMTEITSEFRQMQFTVSDNFDGEAVENLLNELEGKCMDYAQTYAKKSLSTVIKFSVEARYPNQAWEIELALEDKNVSGKHAIQKIVKAFHQLHERIYAVADSKSTVEFITWIAKVYCSVAEISNKVVAAELSETTDTTSRSCYFHDTGNIDIQVYKMNCMKADILISGPVIIESPFTTVVIPAGASVMRTRHGHLMINPAERKS